jgi:hypothetical protein
MKQRAALKDNTRKLVDECGAKDTLYKPRQAPMAKKDYTNICSALASAQPRASKARRNTTQVPSRGTLTQIAWSNTANDRNDDRNFSLCIGGCRQPPPFHMPRPRARHLARHATFAKTGLPNRLPSISTIISIENCRKIARHGLGPVVAWRPGRSSGRRAPMPAPGVQVYRHRQQAESKNRDHGAEPSICGSPSTGCCRSHSMSST